MGIITKLLVTIFGLLLISNFVPGIEIASLYSAFIVAVVLGVFNIIVKPILVLLTLPINLLTLGLFTFVINALLFWFIASFVQGFSVDGFIPAFVGAAIISLLSSIGNRVL